MQSVIIREYVINLALENDAKSQFVAYTKAKWQAHKKQKKATLEWLEKAFQYVFYDMGFLQKEPVLTKIRATSAYAALLEKYILKN